MSATTPLSVVILAAGKGTRMYSDLPKVLHSVGGKPLVKHAIDTAKKLNAAQIHIIYGYAAELLQARLSDEPLNWVYQAEQLGTGHAMMQAEPYFKDDENILMMYADTPLATVETLQKLIAAKPENGIALLTVVLDNPTGYGRILRENNSVVGIVEQKDANEEQLKIQEVNTGMMVASGASFRRWLSRLDNNNAQGEYYITDLIAMANEDGFQVNAVQVAEKMEVEGANNRLQLAGLERYYQQKQAKELMLAGVTLLDPARFDLRGTLSHGKDVEIDVNVVLEGEIVLGDRVKIGAGAILKNCTVGNDVEIKPYSVLEDCVIGASATVGPFARLRPGAELAEETHIGNFVEVKNAQIGKGSKVNHLSYIGDTQMGESCNIGAGTITCNYDGANKHKTVIGNNVFVGSDSQLVAPVTIADNATIGAGATITKDIAENELVITRVAQRHIANWQRPSKKK